MCGRFEIHVTSARIKEHFDLTGELNFSPSWKIDPATFINYIVADKDENGCLKLMHRGLIPSCENDKTIATKLINARSETILQKYI